MTIKLDHINLTVANLTASIEWYGKVFGFELVESGTTEIGTKWGIVASNDSMICMAEYSARVPADKVDDKSVHRICHFGIRVSDSEKWQQTVRDHRLELYYGGENEYPNSRSWYVHDPSGHEIEVSYAAGGRLQFPSDKLAF
jgi:catechol 2,3-dioxygenase-like lactoylglutathione lyase family enzyme